jgi:MFS family permease
MKVSALAKATLLLASTLTVMSGATIAPALPQMEEVFSHVHNAPFLVRLVLTLPALFIVLSAPILGRISDRHGRLKVILPSLILYGVSGSAGFFAETIWFLLITRAVLGIAVAGIMTTATTMIGDLYSGETRTKIIGYQSAFMAMGGVVYVGVGGLLADIDWTYPFLLYSFSLVIFFLGLRSLKESRTLVSHEEIAVNSPVPKKAYYIYVIGFISMLVFYSVPVQIPFYIRELGVGKNFYIGLAIMVSTFFGALTAVNYSRIKGKAHFEKVYVWSFLLVAASYLMISLSQGYPGVLVAMMLNGIGIGMIMPNSSLWLISISENDNRGKILGGLTTSFFLGQFLSPMATQPLVKYYGTETMFGGLGLLLMAFALFIFFKTRKSPDIQETFDNN